MCKDAQVKGCSLPLMQQEGTIQRSLFLNGGFRGKSFLLS